jgi:hypothetical protein
MKETRRSAGKPASDLMQESVPRVFRRYCAKARIRKQPTASEVTMRKTQFFILEGYNEDRTRLQIAPGVK